ncbi:MAG: polyprenol monophosphomannose synthase [Thermoanaerobaculia bacterium]|nr:polyprenol monophosphomannose synthase [Thermoanaerobaculia bacterium]
MRPQVSVIVPTYREADNLPQLIPRITESLGEAEPRFEILVVDDSSPDRTQEVCRELSRRYPLRLVLRRNERGLSEAVLRGFEEARGEVFVVMDADLSHPPERIPALLEALEQGADFALGSRYVAGGGIEQGWGSLRSVNSVIATALARPLTSVRDPMSGFFALRRETVEKAVRLDPVGYKIALELIVRCDCRAVVEVPILFGTRRHGESKLDLRQRWLYLRHLGRLYRHELCLRRWRRNG